MRTCRSVVALPRRWRAGEAEAAEAEAGLLTHPVCTQVRRVCDEIVEDHLEEIVLKFHRSVPEVHKAVCSEVARACSSDAFDDLDTAKGSATGKPPAQPEPTDPLKAEL